LSSVFDNIKNVFSKVLKAVYFVVIFYKKSSKQVENTVFLAIENS